MKHFLLAITAIFFGITSLNAQDLEKEWQFEAIQNENGSSLVEISDTDHFKLNKGEFNYTLESKNNLNASGDYLHQNNLLVFYYTQPTDTIRTLQNL